MMTYEKEQTQELTKCKVDEIALRKMYRVLGAIGVVLVTLLVYMIWAADVQAAEIKVVTGKYGMQTNPPVDAVSIRWSFRKITENADGTTTPGPWHHVSTKPTTGDPTMTIWLVDPPLELREWACEAVYPNGLVSGIDEGVGLTWVRVVESPPPPSRPVVVVAEGG